MTSEGLGEMFEDDIADTCCEAPHEHELKFIHVSFMLLIVIVCELEPESPAFLLEVKVSSNHSKTT